MKVFFNPRLLVLLLFCCSFFLVICEKLDVQDDVQDTAWTISDDEENDARFKVTEHDVTDSRAIFVKNGFRKVVVAFTEDAVSSDKERWKVLKNTMDVLTLASSKLYNATKKRAYFQDIRILIPNSWPDPPEQFGMTVQEATFESFQHADFQVSQGPPKVPYTRTLIQSEPCGRPQGTIQVPVEFLLQHGNKTAYDKQVDARLIVQQWAKHRWGVFEEYVTTEDLKDELQKHPTSPRLSAINLYQSRDFFPNVCIWPHDKQFMYDLIKAGHFRNVLTNETCNPKNKLELSRDIMVCVFHIDTGQISKIPSEIHASIMSLPTIPNADTFCNSSEHAGLTPWGKGQHLQNKHCKHQASWNVITTQTSLEDLYPDKNLPRDDAYTVPNFTFLKRSSAPSIILMLDTSQSHSGKAFASIYAAMKKFVRFVAEDEWKMGVISFNTSAHVHVPLVSIKEERHRLLQDMPIQASGKTCISCAINKAIQVLEEQGSTKGTQMILVTDGLENHGKPLTSKLSQIKSAGASLSAIAIGKKPPKTLYNAVKASTSGRFFIAGKPDDIISMDRALFEIMNDNGESYYSYKVKILSEEIPPEWEAFQGKFPVDPTAAKDLVIIFSFSPPTSIDQMTITDPRGQIFTWTSDKLFVDRRRTHAHFRFPEPVVGLWKYKITLNNKLPPLIPSTFEVSARPRNNEAPLELKARIINDYDRTTKSDTPRRFVAIVAELNQGWAPLTDACVIATVKMPDSSQREVELIDYSHTVMEMMSDGVYMAVIDFVKPAGWYSVHVTASPTPKETKILRVPWPYKEHDIEHPFQRVAVAGTFLEPQLSDETNRESHPCPIRDLRDFSPPFNFGRVTLEWTSPGTEKAMVYEFRYSKNEQDLLTNFDTAQQLTDSDIWHGSLEPKPPGQGERITFSLPDGSYYVAGRAINQMGLKGPVIRATFVISISKCHDPNHYLYQEIYLNPEDCSSFLQCEFPNMPPTIKPCPIGLLFNAHEDRCDWPESVMCHDFSPKSESFRKWKFDGETDEELTCLNYRPQRIQ